MLFGIAARFGPPALLGLLCNWRPRDALRYGGLGCRARRRIGVMGILTSRVTLLDRLLRPRLNCRRFRRCLLLEMLSYYCVARLVTVILGAQRLLLLAAGISIPCIPPLVGR